jgi:probable rRNA maturation factor
VTGVLVLRNRQRARRVDTRYLRRIIRALLQNELPSARFEIGIHLVDEWEIIHLNEMYLKHAGPTDVISFDYGSDATTGVIAGEIFVCVPVAVSQARRFRETWQSELVRYIVHGILHLRGYDDQGAPARRKMKAEEDRVVRLVAGAFSLRRVGLSA